MADPRFLVIAPDVATADALLGVVPASACVDVVVLGVGSGDLDPATCALPADSIRAVPALAADADADVVGPALVELIRAAAVTVLDSSQPGRDLAGWLSATLDRPLVWAIDAIEVDGGILRADRVVLGGSHRLVHEVGVAAGVLVLAKPTLPASAQDRSRSAPADVTTLDVTAAAPRVRVLEASSDAAAGVPLNAARVVVSVGRGIGGADKVPLFRELAERVGAAVGASRVAVDSGWVPFAHQVGQTGTAVAPDLYVAFGISGAIQHLAGMRGSRSIIAINTDVEAPICRLADIVVKADAVEVAEGLLKRLG